MCIKTGQRIKEWASRWGARVSGYFSDYVVWLNASAAADSAEL